jgi:hypothetical protein
MGEADGRVGLVDMLASGAAGAHGFGAYVARVDVVVAVWIFEVKGGVFYAGGAGGRETGHDEDADGAGVSAAFLFGGGDSLDAVDAGFSFEDVVAAWLKDFEDCVCEAAFGTRDAFIGVVLEEVGFPAFGGAEDGVHVEKLGGEEGCFGAACARVDF